MSEYKVTVDHVSRLLSPRGRPIRVGPDGFPAGSQRVAGLMMLGIMERLEKIEEHLGVLANRGRTGE